MDLYISPLSGSFAAHVACLEAGVPVTLHRVDRKTKVLEGGGDYRAIADGSLLTEIAAILQYVADQVPAKNLAPAWGTLERYRLIEWLSFVATELHKKHLWVIFSSRTPDAAKAFAVSTASAPLVHAAAHLETHEHLLGEQFTVADAYLFWALLVAPYGGLPLDAYPSLAKYVARLQKRPSIQAALAIEVPLYRQDTGKLAATTAAAGP
jgi:glutathione S-transferase